MLRQKIVGQNSTTRHHRHTRSFDSIPGPTDSLTSDRSTGNGIGEFVAGNGGRITKGKEERELARAICSGEITCGLVKLDEKGNTAFADQAQMKKCIRGFEGRVHCGLIRSIVSVSPQTGPVSVQVKREDRQGTYEHRMFPMFRDETKGEHLRRIKAAEREGNMERDKYPLRPMMAERLVSRDATTFARMLKGLGMKFTVLRGVGRDSFLIEAA